MPERPENRQHFKTLASLSPPRIAVVMAWLIGLGFVLVVALLFVPWVQTAQGMGKVVSLDPDDRPRQVTSVIEGRVERFFVSDGDQVQAGDPIARVVDVDPGLLSRLSAERAQLEAEIAAMQQARQVAAIDVGRTRQLLEEGLASRREYEQSQIRIAEADATIAEARAAINRIETEINRRSEQVVLAPREGRVQQVNGELGGQLIDAGTVLAVIAPEQVQRAVELYVDARDVPIIERGSPVRLEFEGFPAIQFSGWPNLVYGVYDGQVRTIDPVAGPNGQFRVIVEPLPGAERPWPGERYVRQGSNVVGWIRGNTVTVGFEIWRQLNDFPLQYDRTASETSEPGSGWGSSS
ncbi:efflux RND transporter periplasmic adaptor subunit [Croceicoccus marinus]|uniref:HlyD family efflux transporter periplasmic adaptor subunit n=1 Tax=Croceicoccus marinus TaxID=450378 RepID=A0A1Z1FH34_9SPHN|nr:HlyD family efflux transporter periplasmic adaptor subunit [Croceicoccus marinus]ARU18026.1 RND transporter [Croceicoccus marinus]QNE07529.1 HlyD family efflux transporter periplasmic adaptor subunit [Croceicoccus marinus]